MGLIIDPYRFGAASPAIPTPWLRYRADDVAGVADGGDVDFTKVLDISGNGRHTTAVTATKPKLRLNVVNGHAALDFDAATAIFYTIPHLNAFTEAEVFFIYKANVANANEGAPHNFNASAGAANASHWPFASGAGLYDSFFSNGRYDALTPAVALNTWHSINVQHKAGANNYKYLQDNNLVHQAAGSFQSPTTGGGAVCKFGESGAGLAHFRVAEMILYNSVLSAPDRLLVNTYIPFYYAFTIAP